MIRIIKADGTAEREQIASMRSRAAEVGADIERAVGAVMQDVREKGFSAVEKYSLQFDRKAPYEIGMETLEEAYAPAGSSRRWNMRLLTFETIMRRCWRRRGSGSHRMEALWGEWSGDLPGWGYMCPAERRPIPPPY